jgi:hypothetical protein
MKTVKEIMEIANDRYRYPVSVTNGRIFEILIGITEHLEAEQRREAMIRVLEWQCKSCGKSAFGFCVGCHITSAIVRLREGGDL